MAIDKEKLQEMKQQMIQEQPQAELPGEPLKPAQTEALAQPQVKDLRDKSSFSGVLLVRSAEIRTGKTGNPYMDLRLGDAGG